MRLNSINCNFLTEVDLHKLNVANVHTINQLVTYADLNSLSELTKIPVKNLKLIKKFIIGQYSPFPEQANTLLDRHTKRFFSIQSGCSQLDELISNGVYSNEITEITGFSSSGKTEFCLNLSANLMVRSPSSSVLYIDSNHGFCPIRIRSLLLSKMSEQSADLDKILASIRTVKCSSPFELLDVLFSIKKSVNSSNDLPTPNLLVIDSLNTLFEALFKPNYSLDATFYLTCVSNQLRFLAASLNMAIVVVTNSCESQNNRISNMFNYPVWVRFYCIFFVPIFLFALMLLIFLRSLFRI